MVSYLTTGIYQFLLFLTAKAFVAVQIHRNAVYSPFSPCSFISNVLLSPHASIQTCIWECVHTYDCQTAVYFDGAKVCTMYSELCQINHVQPSGTVQANVICYRKNHNPTATCPASITEATVEQTATEMTGETKIMYLPTDFYALNISKCAKWESNGITVAGNKNGTNGSDLGSLSSPTGIFVDKNNSLFIADRDNNRIMKYNVNSTAGIEIAGNGSAGNGSNQLNTPRGVVVDQYGCLIVADSANFRIQNFSNSSYGTTIVSGNTNTPFTAMRDLHIDNYGNIYVTDANSMRITRSSPNGQTDIVLKNSNVTGSKADQFSFPYGNFVDINQHWYIADYGNHRVQKWLPGATNGTTVAGITGQSGSDFTQLKKPAAVVVDNNGYLYIADWKNGRIMKWTENYSAGGQCVVGCSNTSGTASYQPLDPRDLKFDQYGNLYVCDQGNHRVQKFLINQTSSTC